MIPASGVNIFYFRDIEEVLYISSVVDIFSSNFVIVIYTAHYTLRSRMIWWE